MNGQLVVVGEVNPDLIVIGVPTVRFGQTEDLVASSVLTVGSSAAILACGAARLGIDVNLVGVVGDDLFGSFMITRLRERGVAVGGVRIAPGQATGSSVILVRAADHTDRHILTHLGAMAAMTAEDVSDEALRAGSHLHVSSWFLHVGAREHLGERLAAAHDMGLTTSVDPNHDPDRTWDGGLQGALRHVDLLFVNESEACGLSGCGDPEEAARVLLARLTAGPGRLLPAVVLKLGACGARVYHGSRTVSVQAPDVQVVDTIGAGDTLAAAVLSGAMQGLAWPEILALGVAAGSLSTENAGGVAGQPDLSRAHALATRLSTTTTSGEHK